MNVDEIRTLDAVAGQVADVRVAVARIETMLQGYIKSHEDAEARDVKWREEHALLHADVESRLRALEKARWAWVTAAAALGGAAGKLAGLL